MSKFQVTDITEDEIENGYLLYLSGENNQPPQPNNNFSIINIAVAEGINTLILDSETVTMVTAWTAASLQTYDPLPETYLFFNTDSAIQEPLPDIPTVPYPPSWFTLPDNSKITNIQFTNVNTVPDNYADIVIAMIAQSGFFLLGPPQVSLSNLNNTLVSGNIPPTNISSDSIFIVFGILPGSDPPQAIQLPPDYQIKMLISYTIEPSTL